MRKVLHSPFLTATGVAALVVATAPGPAAAQFGFNLERAGIEFTENDRSLIRQNIRTALEAGPGAPVTTWTNTDTGLFGRAQSVEALEIDGRACQRVEFDLAWESRQARYRLVLCQRDDGRWGIAG